MNIVFIIDQVYLHGGIERVLSIKANYLCKIKGYTVHIVTTEQQGRNPCYHFDSKINFEDLNINYTRNTSYFHPKNLLKLPHHIAALKRRLKNIAPDIVVVCSHSADTYFMPFIKTKIPKIKEFHYSKFIEEKKRENPTSVFKSWFFKFADYVETKYNKLVVLNPDEAAYFNSNNVDIIPNPLTFYPETVSNLNEHIVMSAGRIAPVKRYDVLIDIWELVASRNKDWKLHIYGTGEQKYVDVLKQKIKDKDLTNQVFLKGPTDHIQNKMLRSSLFVMTSDNECFPLVLLEAQACGLPIISFDCPNGPRNIITDKNGRLIKMKDLNQFSETILEMIENPIMCKELGENSRMNAGHFRVDKVMQKWVNLFATLKQKAS